ncbi:MAG: hypothetical protein ABI600_19000 [Luteolibacter sp.]
MKTQNSKSLLPGLLICMFVVMAWFSPWWIGGKNLAPLDILNEMMQPWRGTNEHITVKNHFVVDSVTEYLAYRILAERSFKQEGWVGWSSLTYGGYALYANTMALYYDWTMQLHRWFGFWTAWHLGILCQVMLAAAGMLLFLRGRAIGFPWAICGALAFAANSQFVIWINHRWALSAFCWVPWILWAVDGYRHGKRCFWAWVPIFTALALLGGTLQHGVFVILAVIAAWLEEALHAKGAPSPQLRIFGKFAAWGILGTGMAGMMLLPCIDTFLVSNRLGLHMGMYGNAQMGIYPNGWLQPLCNLAAYPFQIFPSLLGRCGTLDLLKAFKSDLFFVAYFGSLPVLIAFVAFFRKQTPLLARFLIGTGLLLPLTPLVRYLYQRLFLLFILGGILAFAHFMETASRETRIKLCRITGILTGVSVITWTFLSIVFKWKAAMIQALLESKLFDSSSGSAFGYFHEWMHGRFAKFTAEICIWSPQQLFPLALFLTALAGLGLTASVCAKRRMSGNWLIVMAVVLEVTLFGSRWITFTDPSKYPLYPVTPEVTALQRNVADGRLMTLYKGDVGHMAMTPFPPNTLGPYGIASIRGFGSIVPNGMLSPAKSPEDAGQLGRLAVTHLITYPGNAPHGAGWIRIWESPSMVLFENSKAVPRYSGFQSTKDKESFFHAADFQNWIALDELNHQENTRRIKIPAGIEWIRIAENQAPGWQYRVAAATPNEWRSVERAPDASMLLDVSGLVQTAPTLIEMRYHPPLRSIGFAVSGAALFLTLAGGVFVLLQGRRGHLTFTNPKFNF